MKKSDLKHGNIVFLRETYEQVEDFFTFKKRLWQVNSDCSMIEDDSGAVDLSNYNEDLTYKYSERGDIVAVFSCIWTRENNKKIL